MNMNVNGRSVEPLRIHPSRRAFLGTMVALTLPAGAKAQLQSQEALRIATATEPSSFDPHFTYFGPNRQAHMPIFEPLAMYGADLTLKPALATTWRATSATTWEIILRSGVRFHDGSPFSAADVIFSLARARSIPNSPSTLGVYTQAIRNITASDPLRLVVETNGTAPLLMFDLANIPIASQRVSGQATTASFDAGVGVIGTGPYRFEAWQKGRSIRYSANDGYWGGRPSWKSVEVLHISDGAERVKELGAGAVDFMDQVPPALIAALKRRQDVNIMEVPSNFLIFLHMDQFRKISPFVTDKAGAPIANPLLDRRVRKAISLALDRDDIVSRALSGAAQPAFQLLPSSFAGTLSDIPPQPRDLVQARRLLADAGLPDGFRLTIHGTRGRYANDVAVVELVASQLQDIGIDARTESLPSNDFFAKASSGLNGEPAFSMIQVGWASVEPSGALKGLLASFDARAGMGSSNRGRYSNPEVDALLARALQTVNDQERASLLAQATRIAVVQDIGIVPLYFPVNAWAARKGLRFTPRVDSSTFPMDILPA